MSIHFFPKNNIISYIFVCGIVSIFSFFLVGCKSKASLQTLRLSPKHEVLFLDSLRAAQAIITDTKEGFFEKIQPLEMSIQMKQPLDSTRSRTEHLQRYKAFLQTEVMSFTTAEVALLSELMQEIYRTCLSVNSSICPPQVRLIKVTGNHYGESVFYTRDNCIIIPEAALNGDNESLRHTLFHELSHIYTRYNPLRKEQLYSLIGFLPLRGTLVLPDALQRRVLYNPDGVNLNWYIYLRDKQQQGIKAIPVIISNEWAYDGKKKPTFFNYLSFYLYPIEQQGTQYRVQAKPEGTSALSLKELPHFFEQIKDNTNYIIHPDEIIADNFTFVMEGILDPASLEKYSPAGKQLLADVRRILAQ